MMNDCLGNFIEPGDIVVFTHKLNSYGAEIQTIGLVIKRMPRTVVIKYLYYYPNGKSFVESETKKRISKAIKIYPQDSIKKLINGYYSISDINNFSDEIKNSIRIWIENGTWSNIKLEDNY